MRQVAIAGVTLATFGTPNFQLHSPKKEKRLTDKIEV